MSVSRLYRSNTELKVAGVCGGLGYYLQVDPTLVRLFFVFLAFYNFLGVWVYLVLALIVPKAPEGERVNVSIVAINDNSDDKRFIGAAMVIMGVLAFISKLKITWFGWFNFNLLLPILMILVGVVYLARLIIVE